MAKPAPEAVKEAAEMKSRILQAGKELEALRDELLTYMHANGIKSEDLNITLQCEFHDVFGW